MANHPEAPSECRTRPEQHAGSLETVTQQRSAFTLHRSYLPTAGTWPGLLALRFPTETNTQPLPGAGCYQTRFGTLDMHGAVLTGFVVAMQIGSLPEVRCPQQHPASPGF